MRLKGDKTDSKPSARASGGVVKGKSIAKETSRSNRTAATIPEPSPRISSETPHSFPHRTAATLKTNVNSARKNTGRHDRANIKRDSPETLTAPYKASEQNKSDAGSPEGKTANMITASNYIFALGSRA